MASVNKVQVDGVVYDIAGSGGGGGGGLVDSVNGMIGDVVLTASDVGALATTASYVSSFNGSSGAITYTAPVTSVNGSTGAVTLSIPSTASDVGAIAAPVSPSSGDVLKYSGSAWVADAPSVDPDAKTNDMTQSVGVDSSGKLWTAPGGGGSGSNPMRLIRSITVPGTLPTGGVDSSGVNWIECSNGGFNFGFDTDSNGDSFNLTKIAIKFKAYTADSTAKANSIRVSNNANPSTIGKITGIRTGTTLNNYGNWFAEYIGSSWFDTTVSYGIGNAFWGQEWYNNNPAYSSFQAFSIMAVYPASVGFAENSTFEIWGRD